MRISLYCKCGAGANGTIENLKGAEEFRRIWYQEHDGPGHGDCEKEEAIASFRVKHGYHPEPQDA